MKISSRLLLFSFILLRSILYCCTLDSSIQSINIEDPQLSIKPTPLESYTPKDYKGALSCERVHFIPRSRLKLESYASSVHLTLAPSVVIPEKLHTRIQICLHMNASIGICRCEKDAWKTVHKGIWGSVISPYEEIYIDVKFIGDIKGSVTISIEEELQRWRIICLVAGIILLLIAPIVSMWVPFYYSSTMAIGILLVVIILLFQGMKLLPAGRKNAFYLTVYGSLLGAGSFLLHQFSMLVNSILLNFGFSEEMHNPLCIFLLVGIVLAGAGLGYWFVRRFVISDDGSVDVGIAQFVKWAMRIIASTLILQGTSDTLFAWTTVLLCWLICSLLPSFKWPNSRDQSIHWRKAEFLRKTPKATPPRMVLKSPNTPNWRSSTTRDMISHGLIPSSTRRMNAQKHYYSSFHNVPKPKMSKKQWEEFTRESTRNAMAELTSSPEFSEWMIENANRIQIRADDSSDDTAASGSDSTDETIVDNGPRRGLFNW